MTLRTARSLVLASYFWASCSSHRKGIGTEPRALHVLDLESARTMPATLRSIKIADEQFAELSMLCGFDDELIA